LNSTEEILHDICCTQCGCVCDDLNITVRNNSVATFDPGCPLADKFFDRLRTGPAHDATTIEGQAVSLKMATAKVAEILRTSRSPLIYGLSRSATAGQRAACHLADMLGANIDTTASTCHAPSILALQQAGESTSTLGEVRNRSDLVIYWGSNPVQSHPRHLERFVDSPGLEIPGGRRQRTLVVIDVQETETSELADVFIRVERDRDFDLIHALRGAVSGLPLPHSSIAGVPADTIGDLASRMRSSRYGSVFFGLGITHGSLPHLTVANLLELVTDLNHHTRFVARRMRIPGDVTGADSVLCWQTGYPFSVNLGRGFPRYNPGEFTANDLLRRGEVDAALLVGTEGVSKLDPSAVEHLTSIPTIVLDYPTVELPFEPTVVFRTAVYGVHAPGSVYRMDEVPIPLRRAIRSDLPTDDEVLSHIIQRIDEREVSDAAPPSARS